jgi:hypothetical protein
MSGDGWNHEEGPAEVGQCFACDANEKAKALRGETMFLSGIAFALQLKDEAIRSSLCMGHTAQLLLLFNLSIGSVPPDLLREEGKSWWSASGAPLDDISRATLSGEMVSKK